MGNVATLTAHRGYREKFPENTILAFKEALKLDIDSIEMDVHMTRDYRIVVCHDAKLDRTTDKTGTICHMTFEEIREADAGIKFGEEFKGERIPSLDEFLELMATRPDIKVLIELKDYPEELGDFAYASAEESLRLCRKYGVFGKDRLTVVTFSSGMCAWLRTRYTRDDFSIHGFYPKSVMKGSDKDDPYKYYDEVCIFARAKKTAEGMPLPAPASVVEEKARFDEFRLMGIKPCVYFARNTNEEDYKLAIEHGAVGFTFDDPLAGAEILDKLGARKLKR